MSNAVNYDVDSLSSINQSAAIRNLNIIVKNITIDNELIEDLRINWGTSIIKGYITINDNYDIINTEDLNPNDIIVISYTDAYDKLFARSFNILSTTEKKVQGSKTIQLNFQDVISWKLQNIFVNKSYEETNITEVLNYYFSKYIDPMLEGFPIEKEFDNSSFMRKKFIVPKNIDFLTFFNTECTKENFFFYQTKDKIILCDCNKPFDKSLSHNYVYKEGAANNVYGFNIISYRLRFNNIESTNNFPKTKVYSYNPDKKDMEIYNKSFNDYKDFYKLEDPVKNSIETTEEKYLVKEYNFDITKMLIFPYTYNTVLKIVVPGNVKYNILFSIIKVELAGNRHSEKSKLENDIKLSGNYQIYEIQDKFIKGKRFIQKLSLRRINENKK